MKRTEETLTLENPEEVVREILRGIVTQMDESLTDGGCKPCLGCIGEVVVEVAQFIGTHLLGDDELAFRDIAAFMRGRGVKAAAQGHRHESRGDQ